MVCKVCGRPIVNSAANFCEYCGASVKEDKDMFGTGKSTPNSEANIGGMAQVPYNRQQWNGDVENTGKVVLEKKKEKNGNETIFSFTESNSTVTFAQWLILMLVVPMIPIIGPFLYICVLCLLAFGGNKNKTLKNWARVMLIMVLLAGMLLYFMGGQLMSLLNGMG